MSPRKLSEEEIGRAVMAYFTERGFECYPEVDMGGPRPDVVAYRRPLLIGVECKVTFGLAVIAQARELAAYVHRSFVAVPAAKRSNARWLADRVCRAEGVGVLLAHRARDGVKITEQLAPRTRRKVPFAAKVAESLTPAMRCTEPGSTTGGHWTTFRGTMNAIRRFCERHPGALTPDIVREVEHHYTRDSTFKSSLYSYSKNAKMLARYGLRTEVDGRLRRWFSVEGGAS